MSLETATYISGLSATNPTSTDPKAQGDDHLRLLKSTLQATFPNATKAYYLPNTIAAQTSTVTVDNGDDGQTVPVDATSGAITVNLPAASTIWDGFRVRIVKADHSDYQVTIDGSGSETVNGALTEILYQRYQFSDLEYSTALSGWLARTMPILPIGTLIPYSKASAAAPGFLFPNGTTIGDASSGASQRANADMRGLFYHCWTNYSNTVCAVSGGRGATHAADFAAHKTLALPNLAGDVFVGLDNLGGISDAGRLTATVDGANTLGQTNGEQIGSESMVISQARLPNATLSLTMDAVAAHQHFVVKTSSLAAASGLSTTNSLASQSTAGGYVLVSDSAAGADVGLSSSSGSHTPTGTASLGGSGLSSPIVQPGFVGPWLIKY